MESDPDVRRAATAARNAAVGRRYETDTYYAECAACAGTPVYELVIERGYPAPTICYRCGMAYSLVSRLPVAPTHAGAVLHLERLSARVRDLELGCALLRAQVGTLQQQIGRL